MATNKDSILDVESKSNPHSPLPSVGRDHLYDALPPHESYEGIHRYDPMASWTSKEEAAVVRKTDLYLLSWICLMVKIRLRFENWLHLCVVRLTSPVLWPAARSRQSLQRLDG